MKRVDTIILTAICFYGHPARGGGRNSPATAQSHVLPVLVAVNADGKIVRIEPAITLVTKQ